MLVQDRQAEDDRMGAKVQQKTRSASNGSQAEKYADHLAEGLTTLSFASKGDRTKYRLKIAAARALEEIGYQDVKVSDICTYADVALGTFYVYYRDKNEIAIEVVLDFVEYLYERARQVGRGTGEFDAILNTNRFFVAAYRVNAGLMQCHLQLQSQLPEFRQLWRPRHQTWIENLARSISRRGNYKEDMPGSAVAVAHALEGMVFHYLYAVIVSRDSLFDQEGLSGDEDLALMLSTLWYRAVYCKDPPGR
jgi:AcrR family transcriptional regulator